jgi:hypothetical protein
MMKSHAFQDLPLKRIKKLAADFSESEVRESLGEDDDNKAFLFESPGGGQSVMLWNAFNGPMVSLDDDGVRIYAQIQFLQQHNYPVARSMDEINALVILHNWPRKGRMA